MNSRSSWRKFEFLRNFEILSSLFLYQYWKKNWKIQFKSRHFEWEKLYVLIKMIFNVNVNMMIDDRSIFIFSFLQFFFNFRSFIVSFSIFRRFFIIFRWYRLSTWMSKFKSCRFSLEHKYDRQSNIVWCFKKRVIHLLKYIIY